MKGGAKPTEKLLLFYKLSFEAEAKTLSLHSASKRSFSKPVSFAGLLPAPAPRDTFLWKESIQRFTRNLLVPWPPTEGGAPPSIPPAENRALWDSQGQWLLRLFSVEAKTLPCPLSTPPEKHETFVINEGERHEVTVGARQCYRLWKNKASRHCPQEWNGCSILQKILKDFQSEEISKRTLPLWYAFGYFSRKRKVSAGVGCVSPHSKLTALSSAFQWVMRWLEWFSCADFIVFP